MSDENAKWVDRWVEGRIGFHRDEVHPDLISYAERWLGDAPRRVFVPLCGKTLDLKWLVELGHEVVAVELVEQAVVALHEEQGIDAEVTRNGSFAVYRSQGMTVFAGDFFSLTAELVGAIDRIWDRAALVAMSPPRRPEYVRHLRALAGAGWHLLQSSFEYDQSKTQGPPWSVPATEVREHFGDLDVEVLQSRDVIEHQQRFRDQGHDYWIGSTYLIRAE